MSRARRRCWIEVSLSRIARNYRAVRRLVGAAVEVAPVVKADAYRHGAVEVSRILAGEGAKWLAVSSVEEGVALRQAGIACRILVMADMLGFERQALAEFRLTPAIHDLDQLQDVDRLGIRYHLKLDTGMARLGTRAGAEEIAGAVSAARRAPLEGLMTHFASAADHTSPQTSDQIRRFDEIRSALRARGIDPPYWHMAGTVAVAYGRRESWGNMVRPGHAIYGYVSPLRVEGESPPRLLEVEPALSWRAAILAVKEVPAGTEIGYGAMYRTPRAMRIGILAAGYADGVPHRLSNRGRVIAAGRFAPIVGAVSMDLTTVDLSQAPELQPGDAVTLIGREREAAQDAQEMARAAGTISYAVLCGIGARVECVYVD